MPAAVGTEVLNQGASVPQALEFAKSEQDRLQARQDMLAQRQQDFDEREKDRKQQQYNQGAKYVYDQINALRTPTGINSVDNLGGDALNTAFSNSMQKLKEVGGDYASVLPYLLQQTAQIATVHQQAINKKAQEEQYIQQAVKRDPNIDEDALRADVYNHLNGLFTTDNGTKLGDGSNLNYSKLGTPITNSLLNNDNQGKYALSEQPLTEYFAKQPISHPVEESYHDGKGGGYTLTHATDAFHDVAPFKNGKYIGGNQNNVIPKSVAIPRDPNDPSQGTFLVMPPQQYNDVIGAPGVNKALDKKYSRLASISNSPLYTDPTSPLYRLQPGSISASKVIEAGKSWIALQDASAHSMAFASSKINEDKQAIVNNYLGNNGANVVDFYNEANHLVPNIHDTAPISQLSSGAQQPILDIARKATGDDKLGYGEIGLARDKFGQLGIYRVTDKTTGKPIDRDVASSTYKPTDKPQIDFTQRIAPLDKYGVDSRVKTNSGQKNKNALNAEQNNKPAAVPQFNGVPKGGF